MRIFHIESWAFFFDLKINRLRPLYSPLPFAVVVIISLLIHVRMNIVIVLVGVVDAVVAMAKMFASTNRELKGSTDIKPEPDNAHFCVVKIFRFSSCGISDLQNLDPHYADFGDISTPQNQFELSNGKNFRCEMLCTNHKKMLLKSDLICFFSEKFSRKIFPISTIELSEKIFWFYFLWKNYN